MSVISSAPILSKLKVSGGTFYTLSSTVNDFSYLFSDSNIRIAPSKFVAMKLPSWKNTTGQRLFREPSDVGSPTITDPNEVLPKVIQNYTENLIQYSESLRTDNDLSNYAESAWWKTLKMLGGIGFENTSETIIEDGKTKTYYTETEESENYESIIKFVGDVNLLNHVKSKGNEYIEMFVNIPTNQGKMEGIKFKQNNIIHPVSLLPEGGGSDFTSGLEEQYNNGEFNSKAIYDNGVTNQYSVGTQIDDLGVDFEDILNDQTRHKKGDFEFNAIALYYDIFDKNDETTKRTNLYGILFVEDFNNLTAGIGEIPMFKKYQPSESSSGNGFSFRMNLKFSDASNQSTSEISINSFSTVSMELYLDALQRLTKMTDKVENILDIVTKVKQENDRLKTTIMKQDVVLDAIENISENKKNIDLILTGNTNGASSGVRISNEELYIAFTNAINAFKSSENNATVQNIISKKAYLGNLIDTEQNVIEFEDGTKYRWSTDLKSWELI